MLCSISFKITCKNLLQQHITLHHACIFSFFAGSQKKVSVSPEWSKLLASLEACKGSSGKLLKGGSGILALENEVLALENEVLAFENGFWHLKT
jgi:hypothetical protein